MRTIDLFSGCGGMSLGFENSGYQILAAFDNWLPAIEVYKRNLQHDIFELDLSDVTASVLKIEPLKPDLIIGGPPCQEFSISGKRSEGGKAQLTLCFAGIVSSVLPKFFVMENVYNIEKSKTIHEARRILENAGYEFSSVVVDASYIGVPQMRKRYFLIGAPKGSGIASLTVEAIVAGQSVNRTTIHDYFGADLDLEFYYAHPRSYQRRAVFSVNEPSATIRRVNRPIPENYKRHPADKSDINSSVRPLTFMERAQVQTFPRNYEFLGSKTNIETMIANAVPVKLAEYIAKKLMETQYLVK